MKDNLKVQSKVRVKLLPSSHLWASNIHCHSSSFGSATNLKVFINFSLKSCNMNISNNRTFNLHWQTTEHDRGPSRQSYNESIRWKQKHGFMLNFCMNSIWNNFKPGSTTASTVPVAASTHYKDSNLSKDHWIPPKCNTTENPRWCGKIFLENLPSKQSKFQSWPCSSVFAPRVTAQDWVTTWVLFSITQES